jgi:hypothetical protein
MLSSLPHPDLIWSPPRLLSCGYLRVKLTTHLHLELRLRMRGNVSLPPLTHSVHGVALNIPQGTFIDSWIFLFTTASRPALGSTQPPVQWIPGAVSLGVKQPGRKADHSPPSSAEVKNAWNYAYTPPIRLHDVVLS